MPKFAFLEHCIYCGDRCDVNKDLRHPERWLRANVFKQVNIQIGKCLKDKILEV